MAIHRKILRWLEDELSDGNLQLGQDLPDDHRIARAIGVGRGRTREGLKTLEDMDIVYLYSGRGKEIIARLNDSPALAAAWPLRIHTSVSRYPTRDLVQTHMLLKGWSVANIDPAVTDFTELDELLEMMQQGGHSIREFLDLYMDFHLAMCQLSGNDLVSGLLIAIRQPTFDSLLSLAGRMPLWSSTTERLNAENRAILDAVKNGDSATARSLMANQMRGLFEEAGVDLDESAINVTGVPDTDGMNMFEPVDIEEDLTWPSDGAEFAWGIGSENYPGPEDEVIGAQMTVGQTMPGSEPRVNPAAQQGQQGNMRGTEFDFQAQPVPPHVSQQQPVVPPAAPTAQPASSQQPVSQPTQAQQVPHQARATSAPERAQQPGTQQQQTSAAQQNAAAATSTASTQATAAASAQGQNPTLPKVQQGAPQNGTAQNTQHNAARGNAQQAQPRQNITDSTGKPAGQPESQRVNTVPPTQQPDKRSTPTAQKATERQDTPQQESTQQKPVSAQNTAAASGASTSDTAKPKPQTGQAGATAQPHKEQPATAQGVPNQPKQSQQASATSQSGSAQHNAPAAHAAKQPDSTAAQPAAQSPVVGPTSAKRPSLPKKRPHSAQNGATQQGAGNEAPQSKQASSEAAEQPKKQQPERVNSAKPVATATQDKRSAADATAQKATERQDAPRQESAQQKPVSAQNTAAASGASTLDTAKPKPQTGQAGASVRSAAQSKPSQSTGTVKTTYKPDFALAGNETTKPWNSGSATASHKADQAAAKPIGQQVHAAAIKPPRTAAQSKTSVVKNATTQPQPIAAAAPDKAAEQKGNFTKAESSVNKQALTQSESAVQAQPKPAEKSGESSVVAGKQKPSTDPEKDPAQNTPERVKPGTQAKEQPPRALDNTNKQPEPENKTAPSTAESTTATPAAKVQGQPVVVAGETKAATQMDAPQPEKSAESSASQPTAAVLDAEHSAPAPAGSAGENKAAEAEKTAKANEPKAGKSATEHNTTEVQDLAVQSVRPKPAVQEEKGVEDTESTRASGQAQGDVEPEKKQDPQTVEQLPQTVDSASDIKPNALTDSAAVENQPAGVHEPQAADRAQAKPTVQDKPAVAEASAVEQTVEEPAPLPEAAKTVAPEATASDTVPDADQKDGQLAVPAAQDSVSAEATALAADDAATGALEMISTAETVQAILREDVKVATAQHEIHSGAPSTPNPDEQQGATQPVVEYEANEEYGYTAADESGAYTSDRHGNTHTVIYRNSPEEPVDPVVRKDVEQRKVAEEKLAQVAEARVNVIRAQSPSGVGRRHGQIMTPVRAAVANPITSRATPQTGLQYPSAAQVPPPETTQTPEQTEERAATPERQLPPVEDLATTPIRIVAATNSDSVPKVVRDERTTDERVPEEQESAARKKGWISRMTRYLLGSREEEQQQDAHAQDPAQQASQHADKSRSESFASFDNA